MKRITLQAASVVSAFLVFGAISPASAQTADDPTHTPVGLLTDSIRAAAESGATGGTAIADAVGLPRTGPTSLSIDEAGLLAVTVVLDSRPTNALLSAISDIAQVDRVNSFSPTLAAHLDPTRLDELQSLSGVQAVEPVLAPITSHASTATGLAAPAPRAALPVQNCSPYDSESSSATRSDLARLDFGTDGSGVKIGIISNSFDRAGGTTVTSPADDERLGALPGPNNPCGYTTPVEVIREADHAGPDEGRAMAQIIHGIAPAATLAFSTGSGGPESMAESIVALAESGATIIVDDMSYLTEPAFQQGVIAAAINQVRERYGVAYYSSSGNENVIGGSSSAGRPVNGWQTEAYRPTVCPSWFVLPESATTADCMDFDPTAALQGWDQLIFDGTSRPVIVGSWGEAVGGVSTRFVVQLYRIGEASPTLVAESEQSSPRLASALLNYIGVDDEDTTPLARGNYALVIARDTSVETPDSTPPIWVGALTEQESLVARQFDVSSGSDHLGRSTIGHASDGSAVGVAASPVKNPTTPNDYTSFGPGTLYLEAFDPDASHPAQPLDDPVTVSAPMITGVDDARTTFFGNPRQEGGVTVYRFGGTSAAAPTVAAVHALVQSHIGRVDRDFILQAIIGNARPMTNPWSAHTADGEVFGAGLVDAHAVLANLPTDREPSPALLAATGLDVAPGHVGTAVAALIGGAWMLWLVRRRRPGAGLR